MFVGNFAFSSACSQSAILTESPVIKEYNGIKVVRDDLLDGGTKRRAFTIYVKSKPEIDEFVYASP